jgi:hypothetical protein
MLPAHATTALYVQRRLKVQQLRCAMCISELQGRSESLTTLTERLLYASDASVVACDGPNPRVHHVKGHMLSPMEDKWTHEPLGGFQVYKDEGWLSWRDFLGYGEGQLEVGDFLLFEEAREVARAQQMYCIEQVSRTRHRAWSS